MLKSMFTYLARVTRVCYLTHKPPKQLPLVLSEPDETLFSPFILTIDHPKFTRLHFAIDLIIGFSLVITSIILTGTLKKRQLCSRIYTPFLLLGTLQIGAVFGA